MNRCLHNFVDVFVVVESRDVKWWLRLRLILESNLHLP